MATQPTVGVIGGTIWGNRGAEAMLVTTVGRVRAQYPDAHIIVFTYLPKQDRALIDDQNIQVIGSRPEDLVLWHWPFALLAWLLGLLHITIPDKFLPKHARALRACDLLLDVSGIAFADGRAKYLPFNVLAIWPAMLLGVPVVKLAQALGPFKSLPVRTVSRLFLPRCAQIYARGDITADHLRDLGLPADRWEQAADVAFLYEPAYSLSNEHDADVAALEATLQECREAGQTVIGLSPSALVDEKLTEAGRDYVGVFLEVITALGDGYHFVLLPNATREGIDAPRNNDLYTIQRILDRAKTDLPAEVQARIHAVTYDINTAGSRRLIAACDILLTSRFHGMISALSLGVPPLVIGWSHKYAEVLAEFGLEHYSVDFADADADILALTRELLAQRDNLREPMAAGLAQARDLSARQFARLGEWLNE